MAKLIPIFIILAAAALGGGGGYFYKTTFAAPPAQAEDDGEHEPNEGGIDDHGGDTQAAEPHAAADEKKPAKKKKKTKDGHKSKGGHGNESSGAIARYLKFSRQFVIPVVKNGTPEVLMIFEINIRVDSSFNQDSYSYEPRLRDAFLSQLLAFANEGSLPRITEDADEMLRLKQVLLEAARDNIGDAALEILFLDIGIQQY